MFLYLNELIFKMIRGYHAHPYQFLSAPDLHLATVEAPQQMQFLINPRFHGERVHPAASATRLTVAAFLNYKRIGIQPAPVFAD